MKLPTDHELVSMIHSLWNDSLSRELLNISLCMASQLRVEHSDTFSKEVHKQLKRLVREGKLRRERFLPGRPSYTIT